MELSAKDCLEDETNHVDSKSVSERHVLCGGIFIYFLSKFK